MFDTTGVFKRSFIPVDGGYLYYPWRWSPGYLVTEPEYAALVEEWRRVAGFKSLIKWLGIGLIVLVVVQLAARSLNLPTFVDDGFPLLLGVALAGFIVWKSLAAIRLVRGRQAIAPPRSALSAESDLGRALGRPMAVWIVVVSLCFLGWAVLFATVEPIWGVPIALGVSVLVVLNLRIAYRAFRPNTSGSD